MPADMEDPSHPGLARIVSDAFDAMEAQTVAFAHGAGCTSKDPADPHGCSCASLEIAWVTREARGLSSMPVPPRGSPERRYWQDRWDVYTARKVALVAFIETPRERTERMES